MESYMKGRRRRYTQDWLLVHKLTNRHYLDNMRVDMNAMNVPCIYLKVPNELQRDW
jgi:hypothetical protein